MKNLAPILPLLRPRSGEVTWYLALLLGLLCLGAVLLAAGYVRRVYAHRQMLRQRFLDLAQSRGLTADQARLLLDIAVRKRLESATNVLTSAHSFDRAVGDYIDKRLRHQADPLLEELGNIRQRLGFDEVPPDQTLHSTRQLSPGLTLMMAPGEEERPDFEAWVVIGRDERAFTAAPLLRHASRLLGHLAPGTEAQVRFWRQGDTEYRFTTTVTHVDPAAGAVEFAHCSPLERLQHRDFYRLPLSFPIEFEMIPAEADAETPKPNPESEPEGRVSGEVINVSAGGMLVSVQDPVPPDTVLRIVPDSALHLPLAGLICEVVDQKQEPEGEALQLRFQHVDPARERELVRLIYQYQTARSK